MKRDTKLDNLKAFLIFTVVFGHCLEILCGTSGFYGVIRAVIYSFHMPAFVFISGHFANKSKSPTQDTIIKYMCTYLVINTLFLLPPWRISYAWNFLYPQMICWYLLCLCFWRTCIPIISRIRFAVPISLLFVLFVGCCPEADRFLSISRAVCFFPFFLVGYFCSLDSIYKIHKWKTYTVLCISILITMLYNWYKVIPVKMYEYIQSYKATDVGIREGIAMRTIMIMISFLIIVCLIRISPSIHTRLTVFGQNSLIVYLFHVFAIKPFSKVLPVHVGNVILNIVTCLILSFVLCFVLSLPFFTELYNKIINKIVKLFTKAQYL